jgi:hypothetical protein
MDYFIIVSLVEAPYILEDVCYISLSLFDKPNNKSRNKIYSLSTFKQILNDFNTSSEPI